MSHRGRYVGAAVPRPVRVEGDLTRVAQFVALGVDAQTGREELLGEPLGPAAVGQQVLRRLGGKAGYEAVFGRHERGIVPHSMLEQQRDGSVIDQRDRHPGPETPALGVEAVGEALVERLGLLGRRGGDERGPVALAGVAVERELADESTSRSPSGSFMRPSASWKTRSARTLSAKRSATASVVGVSHAEEHQQAGADGADLLPVDGGPPPA